MSESPFILPGSKEFLSAEQINKLHAYSDKDTSPAALHHTLGRGANQAASGAHVHWLPWITLAAMGWSPFSGLGDLSGSYLGGMIRRTVDGTNVEMVGTLKGNTAWAIGQWIFTIQPPYKPPAGKTEILVGGHDSGGAQSYARFDIQGSNGAVIAQFALAAGSNIFLGHMRWSTRY